MNKFYLSLILSFSIFNVFTSEASESSYTLLNPTPDNKLRQMETERPTSSDGTATVNAGRVQIETGFINHTKDKNCDNGVCTKTSKSSFGNSATIRLGLTENTEIQLISSGIYAKEKTTTNNSDLNKKSGFGSTTLRFKYSVGGNDIKRFGFAIIPFIKFPTSQNNLENNDVEGGVGLPFAFNFSNSWSLGGMSKLHFKKDQNSRQNYQSSYYTAYANAIYVIKSITDKFYVYTEYYAYKADISNSDWENTANFGMEYFVTNNLKIDGGVNVGATKAAADYVWFSGFAYRL